MTMPRPPRIQFEGAFYHVYSRGNRRERIFIDDQDYFTFERYLMQTLEYYGVLIYAWCLMPNHFHLLLQTPEANVAQFMRVLLGRYAKYFNRRHGTTGHVFERRYNAILCDKETYFLELIRYIHLNPYRVKGLPLADPGKWKWSSHRYYAGLKPPSVFAKPLKEALSRFGDTTVKARTRYAEFMADGLRTGQWKDFYKVKANLFLGNDTFVETVKRRLRRPVRSEPRALRRIRKLSDLAETVCAVFGISEEKLRLARERGEPSGIRDAFTYAAVRRFNFSGRLVAEFLGRSPSAISNRLTRFDEDPQRQKFLERLLDALRQ
jgi:putative transposase